MLTSQLKAHPLNSEVYGADEPDDGLIQSIKEKGILEPLVVKPDGFIISGHRRWKVAISLGLREIPTRTVVFANDLEEQEALIEFNRQREKTFSQKMREAEKLKEIEAEKAKKRQGTRTDISATLRESERGKTSEKVAEKIGMKPRTYEKAIKVWEASKQDEQAKKWVEDIDKGKRSVNSAHKDLRRIEKKEEIKQVEPQKLTGKYNVIYADPPWRYDNNSTSIRGTADDHYPTMTLEEIKQIPVEKITLDNAALFLWTTSSMIKKAFEVIEAWGFEFKTSMVWVKDRMGTGFFVRSKHEILLIGTKGSFLPMTTDLPESVVFAAKEGHSKKPEAFYEIIEKMYPEQRYIELFARSKREGWDVWGNEV